MIKASNKNTTTSNGRTLYRVVLNGVDYGFMTARARRELMERAA